MSHYLTNKLIRHRLLQKRKALRSPALLSRDHAVLIRVSPGYPPLKGKFLCIPHPSATRVLLPSFDLHVLGMPPAFNLSQDQTLQLNTMLHLDLTLTPQKALQVIWSYQTELIPTRLN